MNMLGIAKRVKARVFQASTSEVYGDPEVHPQVESYWGRVNPIGIRSCYDEGKRCAETLFFDYHRQHKLRIKVARIFNTYGPRMHPNDGRVVSNFIVQALKGEPITLYGEGQQTRSFCYVDDLVEGCLRLMDTACAVTGPLHSGNPRQIAPSLGNKLGEVILAYFRHSGRDGLPGTGGLPAVQERSQRNRQATGPEVPLPLGAVVRRPGANPRCPVGQRGGGQDQRKR